MCKFMKYPTVMAALAVIGLAACGGTSSAPPTRASQGSAPPPLHMVCQGPAVNGRSTVVLIAGDGDPLAVWQPIQGLLARHLRVCAYDRSGEGWSPETSGRQTFTDMAAALHRALAAHNIGGTLVVVGHSLGGDVAITHAHRYPAAVSSVVLVDATPADYSTEVASVIPATANADAASVRAQGVSLLNWRQNSEHLDGQAAFPQLTEIHSLAPGIRLVVLEHGVSWAYGIPQYGAKLEQLWRAGQQEWAKLVPRTKVRIVPRTGHYIYQDAPAVVSGIILTEANEATP
jgi:pimeloyl-ACP methyl ester carboxylesterase